MKPHKRHLVTPVKASLIKENTILNVTEGWLAFHHKLIPVPVVVCIMPLLVHSAAISPGLWAAPAQRQGSARACGQFLAGLWV